MITDSDPYTDHDGDTHEEAARINLLRELTGPETKLALATRTLEWDLAVTNFNSNDTLVQALLAIRPRKGKEIRDSSYTDAEAFADALLAAIKKHKGIFAQEVAALVEQGASLLIPPYVSEAIEWVTTDAG